MIEMTPERDSSLHEMGQGAVLPVVRVRVRQDHSVDGGPRHSGAAEAMSELPWTQAGIDQDAERIRFDQAGIASAAAGQYREAQRHPLTLSLRKLVIEATLHLRPVYPTPAGDASEAAPA